MKRCQKKRGSVKGSIEVLDVGELVNLSSEGLQANPLPAKRPCQIDTIR